jgi:hypothetical protein
MSVETDANAINKLRMVEVQKLWRAASPDDIEVSVDIV